MRHALVRRYGQGWHIQARCSCRPFPHVVDALLSGTLPEALRRFRDRRRLVWETPFPCHAVIVFDRGLRR